MGTPALLLEPRLLLDGPSSDGRMVQDAGGRVVAMNAQAQRILGFDLPHLRAQVGAGYVPVTVREDGTLMTREEQPGRVCMRTREPIRDLVVGIHPAGGDLRWLRVDAEPLLHEAGGEAYGAVLTFAEISLRHRLTLEHRALQVIGRAVLDGRPAYAIFELAAEQVARLVAADGGGVARFAGDDRIEVMGAWGAMHAGGPGTLQRLVAGGELARMLETGVPVRTAALASGCGSPLPGHGIHGGVVVPVRVGERIWGGMGVFSADGRELPAGAEAHMAEFAELLAVVVANMEARAALVRQATADALTGLLNHRAFQERLDDEVGRARRHERPLTLCLLDIDGFKTVNDTLGHQQGDRLLELTAEALRGVTRGEDVLARLGGDEFAVLMPETPGPRALATLERIRAAIASAACSAGMQITVSAGACDLPLAADRHELLALADAALYWSKAHGRDRACLHDPAVVRPLSPGERGVQLARSQALAGLRALARAIDAKDPATREHSDRVADLAWRLAEAAGWPPERSTRLRDAALVHDVGKIGIPDAVLLKPGRLDAGEYAVVKRHAALGAEIVDDVLDAEQVSWVRGHHERPDGRGYPDGLRGAAIPDGAALLALADSYDAMTASRSYSEPMPAESAVAEIRRLAGEQFSAAAVAAFERLLA